MQKSIRQDLSIRIGFVIFCVSVLIGIVYYSFSIYHYEKEFKKVIAHQTRLLSDTFTVQLWLFDLNTTKELCKLFSESPEVSGLRLLDHKKKVVFEQAPAHQETTVHANRELRHKGEKLVGYLDIYYTNTSWEGQKKNILFMGILMVIGTIVGSFLFINILLKRYLSRPLEDLQKNMVLLAKGDFQQSNLVGQKTEIQNIIDTFNKLTISLQERDEEIARKTNALKTEISERKKAEEERKQLQDKLHRAQKMEALGLLAGGVAHDLNNILSGIVSYPELLLMDLPKGSHLRKPIEIIQESGMRAADVVADLLTIARGVATGKETLNLNTIVDEYLASPEYRELEKTHSFVNLNTEADPDLLNMSGSPIHMKKTLMNLVTNASEAIEGGGTVTISTMNRYLDGPLKGYENVRTGEYVMLTVSDDGSGISPGDLERIFEPFYSKKEMGRSGTGLGLAVVWNTVQDHDGYINVRSGEKGTVFELYFPVTRKEAAALKEQIPLEDYLGHGEIILVVDDEERQREIACGMLTKLGYTVEAVSSGEEAIEYVKKKPVDLIVLDMVMPKGINGRETYEEIIKIHPGQKAIIASGFSETEDVKTVQKSGASQYIKKPYILEKIGVAIKEELEE